MEISDRLRMDELETRVLADSFLVRYLLAEASPSALNAIATAADEYQPRVLGEPLPEKQTADIRRMIKWAVDGARNRQESGSQG